MHMPMSSLSEAQLPFLNRFEKYILSAELAFRELVKDRGQWAVLPDVQQTTVLEVVEQGVYDFVEKLGPNTFYGYVDRETISGLLLTVMQDSLAMRASLPEIRPPFHVGHLAPLQSFIARDAAEPGAGDERAEGVDYSVDDEGRYGVSEEFVSSGAAGLSGSAHYLARLRAYVRRANFLLLQLARPEAVCQHRSVLPKNYLSEYLLRQEHFSIQAFIRELMAAHCSAVPRATPLAVSSKWVIFTRTSSELLRLHQDQHLQAGILHPLQRAATAVRTDERVPW
jgi:hypothetical protein